MMQRSDRVRQLFRLDRADAQTCQQQSTPPDLLASSDKLATGLPGKGLASTTWNRRRRLSVFAGSDAEHARLRCNWGRWPSDAFDAKTHSNSAHVAKTARPLRRSIDPHTPGGRGRRPYRWWPARCARQPANAAVQKLHQSPPAPCSYAPSSPRQGNDTIHLKRRAIDDLSPRGNKCPAPISSKGEGPANDLRSSVSTD